MGKLALMFNALRHGSSLADPALWKNRAAATVVVTTLLAILLKLAKAYGYEIPLSGEDIAGIAGAVVVAVSLYFNYATSDKVGVLPDKPGPDPALPVDSPTQDTGPGGMHGSP